MRPVACYQLASWLRYHGYTVKVIEFCHLMPPSVLADITEKYIDSETLAIGVSASFWSDRELNDTSEPQWVVDARTIIDRRHKLPWLLGGSVTGNKLNLDWLKFYGFAEDSLLKWMDENSSKLIRRELFSEQKIIKSFIDNDFVRPGDVIPIELGRGCQFKCRFCSFPLIGKKKGTYLRDFNLIKDEFLENYERWGVTNYQFLDDTVNESEEKIIALADMVQSLPFKLQWVGYNRLDLIWSRPGTIQALKDSGLRSAFFGIESFHPVASAAVGKGWNGKYAKDFLLKLKNEWGKDITWTMGMIAGLPGEDLQSVRDSLQWCIDNEMYDYNFVPLNLDISKDKLWKSEFEREYAKWGYSFIGDSDIEWKNDIVSFRDVSTLCNEIRDEAFKHVKIAAWYLCAFTGLGYTFEELQHKRRCDIEYGDLLRRTNEKIRNYMEYQLR